MTWVATAIGGCALLGAGGSIFGGLMGQKGAKEASQAQGAWTNSALNSINSAWGATHQTTAPWIQMGQGACDGQSL